MSNKMVNPESSCRKIFFVTFRATEKMNVCREQHIHDLSNIQLYPTNM